jgi:hypothetical protein
MAAILTPFAAEADARIRTGLCYSYRRAEPLI